MQFRIIRAAFVAAVVLCGILAAMPPVLAEEAVPTLGPVGGTISLITYPEGAAVYLNDRYVGVTPIRLQNITPGKYLVNTSLAGYANETFPVTLIDGSVREMGANLEPAGAVTVPAGNGSLAIDSNPGGASVSLDGTPAGVTPAGHAALVLNNLPAGNHTLRVSLPGYPDFTQEVTITKNHVVKVTADLGVQTEPPSSSSPVPATTAKKAPLTECLGIASVILAGLFVAGHRH